MHKDTLVPFELPLCCGVCWNSADRILWKRLHADAHGVALQVASPELNLSILSDQGDRAADGPKHAAVHKPNPNDFSTSETVAVEIAVADICDALKDILFVWTVVNKQDEGRTALHLLAIRDDGAALQQAFLDETLKEQCVGLCWEPCAAAILQQLEEEFWTEEHVTLPGIVAARQTLEATAAASGNSQSVRGGNASGSMRGGGSLARAPSMKSQESVSGGSTNGQPTASSQPTIPDLDQLKERSRFCRLRKGTAFKCSRQPQ